MLEDTQVALIDLEKVTFCFQQFEGEPLVASMYLHLTFWFFINILFFCNNLGKIKIKLKRVL